MAGNAGRFRSGTTAFVWCYPVPEYAWSARVDLTFENVEATVRAPVPRGAIPAAASSGTSRTRCPGAWLRPMTAPTSGSVSEWAEVTGGRPLLFAFAAQGGNASGESIDGPAGSG